MPNENRGEQTCRDAPIVAEKQAGAGSHFSEADESCGGCRALTTICDRQYFFHRVNNKKSPRGSKGGMRLTEAAFHVI